MNERHDVLQLIAKAERAGRLIERRARPHPTRQSLVEQPAVQQEVQRGVGGLHLHRLQQRVPDDSHPTPGRRNLFRSLIVLNEAQGVRSICALTDHEKDFLRFARLQVNVQLQCGARIESRRDGVRQSNAVERGGLAEISQTPQELGAVRRQAVERPARGNERDALAKLGVVAIARQKRLMIAVVL